MAAGCLLFGHSLHCVPFTLALAVSTLMYKYGYQKFSCGEYSGERDVRNCQILLVQETVVSVVDKSSHRQKTN